MSTSLDQLVARVGGQRNATIIVGAGGAGLVWFIGRRKAAKSQSSTPVNVMAQGYADTADDPTAIYTGYDQLQQEIDNLRQQPGAPNPNPVPTPTSPPSPAPAAPTPDPEPWPVAVANHQYDGSPLPTYAPTPAQMLGPAPSFNPPAGGYGPFPGWSGGGPTHG